MTPEMVLRLYCRIAIKRGLSARQALRQWREDGGTVATIRFYRVWNEQKATVLR